MTSSRGAAAAHVYRMPFGAEIESESTTRFRIFAPGVASIQLQIEGAAGALPLDAEGDGWHCLTAAACAGDLYRFLLPDGTSIPDPVSRFQPQDIAGPSEVIDPAAFAWAAADWKGRPWEEAVLYELHVGTFTPQGTFQAAIQKLDHLASLGVTGIEVMCLAEFAGNRNWGYDGVLLYAPDSAYGRPEDMKAFIDAAHERSIMVILDVVYSHFGPEGNFLPHYFPQISSESHTTPWGAALNFDGPGSPEVREFILQNALYWIEEFQLDGLRLDASHAIIDDGPRHILNDLHDQVQAITGDRRVHLILEHEQNISERLTRNDAGKPNGYTAQWNHDITHLLAAILGKPCDERQQDDQGETDRLGKALSRGFIIAAEEKGRRELDRCVPPTAFVAFIQTHDLVGNRIFGDRLHGLQSTEAVRAIAAIYLLLPQIPLLFMGEEWAATAPFPYFCDYHGDLAEAVRKGRCDQLAAQDPAPSAEELSRAPDPQAESTLRSAQLRWEEAESGAHAEWLAWYQRILAVRRERIVPLLRDLAQTCGEHRVLAPGVLHVAWTLQGGRRLHLDLNLCGVGTDKIGPPAGEVLWQEGPPSGPWSIRWSIDATLSTPC